MSSTSFIAIILAAGRGTRMRSPRSKVAHPLLGVTVLDHCIRAVRAAGASDVTVVLGDNRDEVTAAADLAECRIVLQPQPLGTGDAAHHGLAQVPDDAIVLVTNGDMPLLRAEDIRQLIARADGGLALASAELDDPGGLGRLVRDAADRPIAIVERGDLSDAQRAIREVNVGIYAAPAGWMRLVLEASPWRATGERYITDLLLAAVSQGRPVTALPFPAGTIVGTDTQADLARAATALRRRVNDAHLANGVGMVDPATTYIDIDVVIGAGTWIEPGCHLLGRSVVGVNCVIGPNSLLRDSTISDDCRIVASFVEDSTMGEGSDCGPFAHLRRGAVLGRGVHVGNFGEIKASALGDGSKMGHFSYVGDATIGSDVNIGAGTVTCNYDGAAHHTTTIGDGAFIGSDTMLVAPVVIGAGATTGAGSVVTRDVPPGGVAYGVPARLKAAGES